MSQQIEYVNPFTEQTPKHLFVGREPETRTFKANLDALDKGVTNHTFVAGLHGTGKTSYLDHINTIAKLADFVAVFSTVDEDDKPLGQISSAVLGVAEALDIEIGGGPYEADWLAGTASLLFRQPKRDALSSDALTRDFRVLSDAARDEAGKRGIVLCLDEGQRLSQQALSALKNAVQHQAHMLVVLSLRLDSFAGSAVVAGRAMLDAKASQAERDYGASRLFVTEVPMGAFSTEAEGVDCVATRLEGNALQFEPALIRAVVRLGDNVPRDIIRYAHKVYNLASVQGLVLAPLSVVDAVVEELHEIEVQTARDVVEGLSGLVRSQLAALLERGGAASTKEIAHAFGPGSDRAADLEAVVHAELGALASRFSPLTRSHDGYELESEVHVQAVRLALAE